MELAEHVRRLILLISIVHENGTRLEKRHAVVEDKKKGRKMYCTTNQHPLRELVCKWN